MTKQHQQETETMTATPEPSLLTSDPEAAVSLMLREAEIALAAGLTLSHDAAPRDGDLAMRDLSPFGR